MGLNNKELDDLIYQFFDKNEHVENCILINADEQSALILGKDAEKLYLKKNLLNNSLIMKVKKEVLNGLKVKFNPKEADDMCEALFDVKSEINKALRRYIVSDRLMDDLEERWKQVSANCSEIEGCFSKCKDGINHLLKEIDIACEKCEFDIDKCFWVVAGEVTNSFIVRYYYSQNISAEPIIANPRLLFFSNRINKVNYEEKANETLNQNAEVEETEHESEVFISLYSDNEMNKIGLRVSEDEKKDVNDYVGPIFVAADDKFEVYLEDSIQEISLPYNVLPLDCDLVDVAVIKKENQLFLRIRRTQYPTRIYDILIEQDIS